MIPTGITKNQQLTVLLQNLMTRPNLLPEPVQQGALGESSRLLYKRPEKEAGEPLVPGLVFIVGADVCSAGDEVPVVVSGFV